MTETESTSDLGIDALILAGGFGTRLQRYVPDVPKPLAPVGGQPFLSHQLDWLAQQGIRSVALAVHHMADQIIAFANARDGHPLPLQIIREHQPLGTGGAVANAFNILDAKGPWLVINGDTHFNFDIAAVLKAHQCLDAGLTVTIAKVKNAARFGTVLCSGDKITRFLQAKGVEEPGSVNCGAYIIEPEAMKRAPSGKFSIEIDFFPDLVNKNQLNAVEITSEQAFFDIGTPEAYDEFCSRHTSPTK